MKKLLWFGFLGTILSLVCDLLLGWMVYPEAGSHYVAMIASCAALSNGLGMANMALGGMIPFLGILIWMYGKKVGECNVNG